MRLRGVLPPGALSRRRRTRRGGGTSPPRAQGSPARHDMGSSKRADISKGRIGRPPPKAAWEKREDGPSFDSRGGLAPNRKCVECVLHARVACRQTKLGDDPSCWSESRTGPPTIIRVAVDPSHTMRVDPGRPVAKVIGSSSESSRRIRVMGETGRPASALPPPPGRTLIRVTGDRILIRVSDDPTHESEQADPGRVWPDPHPSHRGSQSPWIRSRARRVPPGRPEGPQRAGASARGVRRRLPGRRGARCGGSPDPAESREPRGVRRGPCCPAGGPLLARAGRRGAAASRRDK